MKTVLASFLALAFLASTPAFAGDKPAADKAEKKGDKKEGRQEEGRKKDDKKAAAAAGKRNPLPTPLPTASPRGEGSRSRASPSQSALRNASSAGAVRGERRRARGVRRGVHGSASGSVRRSTSSSVRALPSLKYGAASHTPRSDGGLLPPTPSIGVPTACSRGPVSATLPASRRSSSSSAATASPARRIAHQLVTAGAAVAEQRQPARSSRPRLSAPAQRTVTARAGCAPCTPPAPPAGHLAAASPASIPARRASAT